VTTPKCLDWQPFMPKELTHACELPRGHDGKHRNTFEDPKGYWWRVEWSGPAEVTIPPPRSGSAS
jgi:hypothetical protein